MNWMLSDSVLPLSVVLCASAPLREFLFLGRVHAKAQSRQGSHRIFYGAMCGIAPSNSCPKASRKTIEVNTAATCFCVVISFCRPVRWPFLGGIGSPSLLSYPLVAPSLYPIARMVGICDRDFWENAKIDVPSANTLT